ncbi:MAG TPA: 4-hydroxythreonine-4-phosphate dehydrogenase PdxA [Acetobacteraceae bacterium]|nr:4-hydroxythreonine-4-phosphate dehydrogenase PdxA [Acetobacteraceae bacterium]
MTIAISMGDPAGIGPEITAAAWRALRTCGPSFTVLADQALMRAQGVPVRVVARPDAAGFAAALPVVDVKLAAAVQAGRPDAANAGSVIASIERAVRCTAAGEACAVVTNPISKAVLQAAGFPHPGHTEFLAELMGVTGQEVMMLAAPGLRVVPVTIHVALRHALDMLRTERIIAVARVTHAALRRDFGIAAPRLAVAGLNPHAGEEGRMGDEEQTMIAPAIAALRTEGIAVSGPWPPDTMFTETARQRYDAAICHYHDQALIPLKTLDMWGGVNVTLGLPIVRTSPDHGTAFDIAGKGVANPASLIAALRMADMIARNRNE